MYPYSEGTVLSFQKVHWQGRQTDSSVTSSTDFLNVWSYNSTTPTITSYLTTGLNPLEIFGYVYFFLFSNKFINYWYSYIAKFQIRTENTCRICAKNSMENFWQLWSHREWHESVLSCMYSRKVVIIECILRKIKWFAFIKRVISR